MTKRIYVTLAVIAATSFTIATAQQTAEITASGIGYLQYLPEGYHASSKKYPLVISLHGIKEKGTSSTDPRRVMQDLPKVDNVGLPRYVKQGKRFPFILISPQLKNKYGTWPPAFIMEVLNYVRKKLRIDNRRIYLTGLSLGGLGVWKTAGAYPKVFAAIAPVCSGGNALNKARDIAHDDVAVWAFHGSSDNVVPYTVTTRMVNAINRSHPNPLAKVTLFPHMGHAIWDRAYLHTNLLDWMMRFRNGSPPHNVQSPDDEAQQQDENKPQQPDNEQQQQKDEQQPQEQQTEQDKGAQDEREEQNDTEKQHDNKTSDSSSDDGQTSANNTSQDSDQDDKPDGKAGNEQPRNNENESASTPPGNGDAPNPNLPPVVNAGPDQTVILQAGSFSLHGQANDQDGTIAAYRWRQISGPDASMQGTTSRHMTVSGLKEGVYVFQLNVKDNAGAGSADDVVVRVRKPFDVDIKPTDNHGHDRSDQLPFTPIPPRGA